MIGEYLLMIFALKVGSFLTACAQVRSKDHLYGIKGAIYCFTLELLVQITLAFIVKAPRLPSITIVIVCTCFGRPNEQ